MVSIKISRGKFPRPGPDTSALRMLERLTAVKTKNSQEQPQFSPPPPLECKTNTFAKSDSDLLKKYGRDISCKVAECYRHLYGGGQVCAPDHTIVCKILQLCRAISSLTFDVSPVHLLKRPYFQGALSSSDDGYCAYWS